MQSKGVIKLLAILLAIACIYQLSFSLKARSVDVYKRQPLRSGFRSYLRYRQQSAAPQ